MARALLMGAAALAILAACIQGPWDYYPGNPPPFRGISVWGYAISGRPVDRVCFERLLDLGEEATQAFAFYDSAEVRITGRFGDSTRTLFLTAVSDTPNCFKGDSTALVQRAQNYELTATLVWDSAGRKTTSVLRGTARVPTSFRVNDTATAPGLSFKGGIPANIFDLGFLTSLPADVQDTLLAEYGDTLSKLQNDSAGLRAYLAVNGKAIQTRLVGLLEKSYQPYTKGATLFYLNGALNTLSHYYNSKRSTDVGSVLITQRFDTASSRPETAFDSPLGFAPDSQEYYFPGNHRRLLIYPDAKGRKGWNLLDSIGVVNVWFHTDTNRLYFYGMEKAYYDFIVTVRGDGGDPDPRVKPKFNVSGGRGFFVGGIPDSFDIVIKADSLTKVYPLQTVRGLHCREEGWYSSKDCAGYYRQWCSDREWKGVECRIDAIRASREAALTGDTVLQARTALMADSAGRDPVALRRGVTHFCVEQNFPTADGACAVDRKNCLETGGINGCKQTLWEYCKDNAWRTSPESSQCGAGLAGYCRDKPRLSETLCRNADAWCAEPANAGSVFCK